MKHPSFLNIPERTVKPRDCGLTHVIDIGAGLSTVRDTLQGAAHLVDVVKLGWGTSYVDRRTPEKINILHENDVLVSLGGTLFEAALLMDRVEALCDWAESLDVDIIEVSSGTIELVQERKLHLIRSLSDRFTVLSEVGSKDVDVVMAPYRWVDTIRAELDAGAWKVVAEGRERGTAGLYRRNGEIRQGLVDEIINAIDPHKLLFEAPLTEQQAWFIKTLGSEVNLGNIAWDDVISLETLRLGLRNDTLLALLTANEEDR